jgi:hypothetical protein
MATAPGTKVFLLLFLQKKKNLVFLKKKKTFISGVQSDSAWHASANS